VWPHPDLADPPCLGLPSREGVALSAFVSSALVGAQCTVVVPSGWEIEAWGQGMLLYSRYDLQTVTMSGLSVDLHQPSRACRPAATSYSWLSVVWASDLLKRCCDVAVGLSPVAHAGILHQASSEGQWSHQH